MLTGCWRLESGEESRAPSWGQVGPESNTHSHPRAFPAETTLTSPPPGTGGQKEEVQLYTCELWGAGDAGCLGDMGWPCPAWHRGPGV